MSSWELAWIVFSLDHQIQFKRVWESFDYEYEGQTRKYIPDFYLEEEEEYVEIKGYRTKQWEAKLKSFPGPIRVMYKKEMIPVLEYVTKTYGENFLKK